MHLYFKFDKWSASNCMLADYRLTGIQIIATSTTFFLNNSI